MERRPSTFNFISGVYYEFVYVIDEYRAPQLVGVRWFTSNLVLPVGYSTAEMEIVR